MAVTETTLDGWFKDRYETKGRDIVPEHSDLAESMAFAESEKLGDEYVFNVRVRRAHGMTWGGQTATAFALNAVVSGQTVAGREKGYQAVMREQIAYGVVSRAKSSVEAFGAAFDDVVRDMRNSMSFYRELNILYGGDSIGTVTGAGSSATSVTYVITEAAWAPGLWAQMEGASVDVYSAPGGTQRNTNGALTVSAIDFDTRSVTLTGAAADNNAVQASDVIIPFEADGAWFDGLKVLVPNTGTMHNINASSYGLWKGNSIGAGSAALTFAKVMRGAARVAFRGGLGKLTLRCSPYTWSDFNNDAAALRRYAAKMRMEADLGTEKLAFYGQTGEIEIKPHPMIKAGEAYLTADRYFRRVGSADLTFRLPGVTGQQERFFRELESNAGFELRQWWDQALVSFKPACSVLFTGIVNSQAS